MILQIFTVRINYSFNFMDQERHLIIDTKQALYCVKVISDVMAGSVSFRFENISIVNESFKGKIYIEKIISVQFSKTAVKR